MTVTRSDWWPPARSTTSARPCSRCRTWPAWWPRSPLRANPHDLDELGVAAGGSVRLRTATAVAVLTVVPDGSLPRKVVAADFNVPLRRGDRRPTSSTPSTPVIELRMETP